MIILRWDFQWKFLVSLVQIPNSRYTEARFRRGRQRDIYYSFHSTYIILNVFLIIIVRWISDIVLFHCIWRNDPRHTSLYMKKHHSHRAREIEGPSDRKNRGHRIGANLAAHISNTSLGVPSRTVFVFSNIRVCV